MAIEKLLPRIQKNILLKNYTTFKIGGPARYFFVAESKEDLIKAIQMAKKLDLPFFILGGGSNLLVSDEGYKGLVIKIQNTKYPDFIEDFPMKSRTLDEVGARQSRNKIQNTKIMAEAGTALGKLVSASVEKGLTGLEWAAGIPGTIGGAIYGNAAAFGTSIGQLVESVEAFDSKSLKIKKFSKRQCRFSTKDNIFKRNKNQSTKQSFVLGRAHKIMCSDLIILSAILKLKKGNKKPTVHIQEIQNKIKEYLNYRKEKHPDQPSAGSVFVNPQIKIKNRKLLKQFPQLKEFNKKGFIPAAWLIEKCGLKGKRIGNVKISEKHANFIVNLGNGRASDVLKLIKLIKNKVKKRFGIKLEEEIEYLK